MLKSVLIIYKEKDYREKLKQKIFSELGLRCEAFAYYEEVKMEMNVDDFDIYFIEKELLSDTILKHLSAQNKTVIVLTKDDDIETHKEIGSFGIFDYNVIDEKFNYKKEIILIKKLMDNRKTTILLVDNFGPVIYKLLDIQRLNYVKFDNNDALLSYIEQPENHDSMDMVIFDYLQEKDEQSVALIRKLRTTYRQEELPIIFLTETRDNSIVSRLLKIGANDYIYKPFTNEEFITHISNILKIHNQYKKIQTMQITDILTGVRNREYFYKAGEQILSIENRAHNPVSVAMINIDNFKTVVEQNGYSTGDKIIISIAKIIKTSVRRSDVVVRFGGNEFVILFPNCKNDNAFKILQSIRKKVEDTPIQIAENKTVEVTVSSGVTSKYDELENMVIKANMYTYKAKKEGKNMVYTEE